jgi:hypothetical protein
MKVFFQTLLPKSNRAEAPDARTDAAKAEEKAVAASAVPQTPGSSGKSADPVRGEDDAAGGRPSLTLEAGDFIDRIPHHLLRFGSFDLHKPLVFDMAEIADRIARGLFTIPLADLLETIPEMFVDDAQTLRALEIRFPWQRVMQMVNESAAAQKDKGGETLAQKLRRMRKINKPAARAAVQEAPVETRRDAVSQVKRGAARDGENAWFSKRAITFEGTDQRGDASQEKAAPVPRAAPSEFPEVPESAPALFELPRSKGPKVSSEAQPPPSSTPIQRPAASPAPGRGPVSDLTDLRTEPGQVAHSGNAGAIPENAAPPPNLAAGSANSGAGDSELKLTRTRVAFLEAELKTLSSKHQNEVSILQAQTDRLVGEVRAEMEKGRLELMAQFQFERQHFELAKNEQLARLEAEYRAGVAAQQNQISELRAVGGKAPDGERQDSVVNSESRLAELKALEARIEPLSAELEFVKTERDQLAELLLVEEQRAAELAARLEFDLFALRVESSQIVAQERERADQKIAELESRFARERAGSQDALDPRTQPLDLERSLAARDLEIAKLKQDCANHANAADAAKQALARLQAGREGAATEQLEARCRSLAAAKEEAERGLSEARNELELERQQVMAERQQLLREMTARAETSAVKRDEALAPLRDDLEKAEALAAAQAAAHERVAAQWEEDVQTYRKRIQVVLGEKTALAAKLREAETALRAASVSVGGTGA